MNSNLQPVAVEEQSQDRFVDPNQVVPLYHQIYLILREQILEGRYSSHPLPGELALAEQFRVSRVTMRRALQDLVKEGLIARGRGKGTFVRPMRDTRPSIHRVGGSAFDSAVTSAPAKPETSVVEVSRILPPQDVADLLGLGPKDQVQKAVRVRIIRDLPVAHLTTYIPERYAQDFGRRELLLKPVTALLEEGGVQIGVAKQSISARLADAVVASSLQVPVGAPLLAMTRIVFDRSERPVLLLRALYRPDRFDYRMELAESPSADVQVWVHRESQDDAYAAS